MPADVSPSPISINPRRGIATLEFAMALPFLLLLMVGITWLGYSVIGQSQVLIKAREKTWQQRFDDKAKAPMIFPTGLKSLDNPLYPGDNDYVTETATQAVHVSPVFDKAPPPKASNTVLAGSWDHRAMPFTSLPDMKLMATAGVVSNPFNAVSALGGMFDGFTEQAIGSLITGMASNTGSGDPNAALDQAKQKGKSDENDSKTADKKKWQDRLNELGGKVDSSGNVVVTVTGGQLDQTIKEIQRLQGQVDNDKKNANNTNNTNDNKPTNGANNNNTKNTNGADDDAQKEAQKKQSDADQRDLDLMKGKRKRLESDIRDADTELKAAG
jgi:hypothetical protein